MDINFELYKIFYHAGRFESFSTAAEKLYISQSAISQSIKSLEEKTGVKLFFRKGRNVILTREGEILYKHIEQAYNFIKTGESRMQELKSIGSGEIRIGASDTVCKYHLLPFIQRYSIQYPNIKIQLVNRTSHLIHDSLKRGRIDFGIVTHPIHDKSLSVKEFLKVQDIFVAGEKFDHLSEKPVALKELCKNPLLLLPSTTSTRKNLNSFLKDKEINISAEIELESIDLLVEFAKIGMGIACVLKESAEAAIKNKELFEVNTSEKLPARELGIITMDRVPLSKAAEEFILQLSESQNNH